MPTIRPISDLRNKFSEISDFCKKHSEPVFLTKNGTISMVIMSIEHYHNLTCDIESKLDESYKVAELLPRLKHDDVFKKAKNFVNELKTLS